MSWGIGRSNLFSMSISKFLAHLLGKSELNSLAGRSTQFSNTFGDSD